MNARLKQSAGTVLFMFAVTFVCLSVVTAVHLAARDAVARNATLFLKRAVLAAAGLAVPADAAGADALYADAVRPEPAGAAAPDRYTVAVGGGRRNVFGRSGAGLWGRITAAVGVAEDGRSLAGVVFTDQNETPGLGARIDEPWFRAQLAGKQPPLSLVPEGTRSASPHEIDGITGATITSTAVRDLLNNAVRDAAGGRPAGER